jgi:hypothetical protein
MVVEIFDLLPPPFTVLPFLSDRADAVDLFSGEKLASTNTFPQRTTFFQLQSGRHNFRPTS